MSTLIKVIRVKDGEGSKQSRQHETLTKKSKTSNLYDSLEETRREIDEAPLKKADRPTYGKSKSDDEAPLEVMTKGRFAGVGKTLSAVGLGALGAKAVSTAVNNIGLFTNDQSLQNSIDNTMEGVNTAGTIAGATMAGAMAGSVVPGIGTGIGAAVGALVGMTKEAIDIAVSAKKLSMEMITKIDQSNRDSARLGHIASVKR